MVRLHRMRDDIEWLLLDQPPADFSEFDAWIDPAIDEEDLDGFVAESQVCGKIVVAARTAINAKRLEKGRTGILFPPRDPNELTHAILAGLFKPEIAQQKTEAAKQTISKFHPRQRLRALTQLLR
jgi:glycosyltransferase involved in cell wall biosynthesis